MEWVYLLLAGVVVWQLARVIDMIRDLQRSQEHQFAEIENRLAIIQTTLDYADSPDKRKPAEAG